MLKKRKILFGTKLSYLDIYGLELEKGIAIFEISSFDFVKMQSSIL